MPALGELSSAVKVNLAATAKAEPGGVLGVLDYLNRPLYGLEGGVRETYNWLSGQPGEHPAIALWDGVTGARRETWGDWLREGVQPTSTAGKIGTGVAGLALDVAGDPVTYATFGFGAGAKVGVNVGGKVVQTALSKAGQRALREIFKPKAIEAVGAALAKEGKTLAPDLFQKTVDDLARANISKEIEAGASHFIDKGGIKLTLPFSEGGVIGKHLPTTEINLVSRGPIAAGANKVGAAVDTVFEKAIQGVGKLGQSTTVKSAAKLFAHDTGFEDFDQLRQHAKGMENVFGSDMLKELEDFGKNLKAGAKSNRERELVALAAEDMKRFDEIANTLQVTPTPELRKISQEYQDFWKRWANKARSKGVEIPELGMGVDAKIMQLSGLQERLGEKLVRAKEGERKKIVGEMARLGRRLAAMGEAKKVRLGKIQDLAGEQYAARMGLREAEAGLKQAQQQASPGVSLPAKAPIPEYEGIQLGSSVIVRHRPAFAKKDRTVAGMVSKLPTAAGDVYWVDTPHGRMNVKRQQIELPAGPTGAANRRLDLKQAGPEVAHDAQAARKQIDAYVLFHAGEGDTVAQALAQRLETIGRLEMEGRNKDAGIAYTTWRNDAMDWTAKKHGLADWREPVHEAEIWKKIRPELEAAGMEGLPPVKSKALVEKKLTEMSWAEAQAGGVDRVTWQRGILKAAESGEPIAVKAMSDYAGGSPSGIVNKPKFRYTRDGETWRVMDLNRPAKNMSPGEIATKADTMLKSSTEVQRKVESGIASHIGRTFDPEAKDLERVFADPVLSAEAESMMAPVKAMMKERFGDKVTLYRAETEAPKGAASRNIFSYSLSEKVALKHAEDTGRKVVAHSVPLENILWVSNKGGELEVLVRREGGSAPAIFTAKSPAVGPGVQATPPEPPRPLEPSPGPGTATVAGKKAVAPEVQAAKEKVAFYKGAIKGMERGKMRAEIQAGEFGKKMAGVRQQIVAQQRQYGDVTNWTDRELEKVRKQLGDLVRERANMPNYVPHVISQEFRNWLKESNTFKGDFSTRVWTDRDPHAAARSIVDQWGIPLTAREVNDAINIPGNLESLRDRLVAKGANGEFLEGGKAVYRKLEFIREEFPAWFKEQQAKSVQGWLKGKKDTNMLARWAYRAPATDIPKVFDVDPEKVILARTRQMSRAVRGAYLFEGLRGMKNADIILPIEKAEKGWATWENIVRDVERAAEKAGKPLEKGWQDMNALAALKGQALHPDVAAEVVKLAGKFTSDQDLNAFVRGYDKVLSFYKRWVLVAPAYVVRNVFGNAWNNFYAGVKAEAYGKALMAMSGKDITVGGIKYSAEQFKQFAREWDIMKGGQYGQVFAEHLAGLAGKEKSAASKIAGKPADWIFQANNAAETHSRLAHFISKLDDGMKAGEAARSVTKYLFDYGEFSRFEDTYMRRMVFFYSWLRNNMALQVGQMFHEPWKVLAPLKAASAFEKAQDAPPDIEAIQPEWTKRMLNAYLGRDPQNGDIKILTQFGLPVEDLFRLNPSELVGQVSPLIRIPAEVATGIRIGFGKAEKVEEYDRAYSYLKALPESVKDQIGFAEITYPNGDVAYRMNPWALYAFMNNPWSRFYTQLGKIFDEKRGVGEKLMMTFTGIKIARFNEDLARLAEARKRLAQELSDATRGGRIGYVKRFFARKGEAPSQEEAALLTEQKRLDAEGKRVFGQRSKAAEPPSKEKRPRLFGRRKTEEAKPA